MKYDMTSRRLQESSSAKIRRVPKSIQSPWTFFLKSLHEIWSSQKHVEESPSNAWKSLPALWLAHWRITNHFTCRRTLEMLSPKWMQGIQAMTKNLSQLFGSNSVSPPPHNEKIEAGGRNFVPSIPSDPLTQSSFWQKNVKSLYFYSSKGRHSGGAALCLLFCRHQTVAHWFIRVQELLIYHWFMPLIDLGDVQNGAQRALLPTIRNSSRFFFVEWLMLNRHAMSNRVNFRRLLQFQRLCEGRAAVIPPNDSHHSGIK